ncbi:hypothetical protein B0A54_00946 [Friedmanniomyces endolithicus]|uniref:Thiolase N-terminal domain-containing protein n=1 Tax=Friedmanniomyces endolithicus TaxID=329885 RepID=A0A4U0VI19_9PEZI|nr:hypothetical protein LTS09_008937 [Friedmanniomyces endolithicus]TKA48870.1 hypothetical protein B0A54_00946 [Friedmanniomyces endolithicus]
MATEKMTSLLSNIAYGASPLDTITQKNPDDIVITLAIRTPMCRYQTGSLSDTPLDALVLKILEQVRLRSSLDPALVEDICLGNVRDGQAAQFGRAAALTAGFPNTTAACRVNRFCSSGLAATQNIANEIAAGSIDIGIAVGAESLSTPNTRLDRPFVDEIMNANQDARDCMQEMGQTSENVAKDFGISRQKQDAFALVSNNRAEAAQRAGWFDDEIVPITTHKDGKKIVVDRDEIRYGTTYERLSKLSPAFPEHGDRSTAGNSSQITDGAAAVLLMKRSKALELGQPIVAKYVGTAIAGVPPRIMGIGPVFAIPKLLSRYNLSLQRDIDVVEINEAFASMAVYCKDKLEIDWSKLNPRGGAIALGHPVGCTGARQIVTGLSECRRRGVKVLLTRNGRSLREKPGHNCADCPPIPHYWFSGGILVEDFHSRHGKTLEDSNDFGPCMSGMPDSVEPMQE